MRYRSSDGIRATKDKTSSQLQYLNTVGVLEDKVTRLTKQHAADREKIKKSILA